IWEVVDNSVDEAMAGHCTRIDVTLLADGGCRVTDDGRGIPVDPHPRFKKKSGVEIALTVLHAGGKFGGAGYKVSGGLHGVGVSVVNALSSRLVVEVDRNGSRHRMEFAKGGKPQGSLEIVGTAPRGRTGTTVEFWPDATIFEEVEFRAQTVLERLQMMAFLNRGLEIRFEDQRPGHEQEITYRYNGGIIDFVRHLNASKEALFKKVCYFQQAEDAQEVELALQWNTGFHEGIHSFANGIATGEGGMHEEGLKKSLTNVVNRYSRAKNLLKEKEDNLLGEDIREGLTAILAVRLQDPQFEGQTKSKLGNVSMRSLVERATNEKLAEWLEEHPSEARQIVQKSLQAARGRLAARNARDLIRRKSALEGAGMPGKLTDCSTRDPKQAELFIVEGDSAGGSAIRARNPQNQAILPIRGKILNVERARIDRMLKNTEIQALIGAIGAGVGEEFDETKIRYGRVILLADADVDGSHIRTLLLTFFFRQMRELVEEGMIYIAQPPLYQIRKGKQEQYAYSDEERDEILARFKDGKDGKEAAKGIHVQRYKGLGEMNADQLFDTTMDPATRTLLRVTLEDAVEADSIFTTLMGEDVDPRRRFIEENARYATLDV
ncbi:MAG: DNA gyrase/topoisomerase IV subunit B, partial [Longimicrobiaceae bacterium]